MLVYRVAKKKYARDLTGEGARLNGGRWNHPLTPCLYTSESRALALLEFSVNVDAGEMPSTLIMLTLEVPEDEMMEIRLDRLPANWKTHPVPDTTKNLGNLILNESFVQVIGVPSVVVPEEWNYLVNPRTLPPGWPRLLDYREISYDFRIKQ
jgi:RES domain-containing protein